MTKTIIILSIVAAFMVGTSMSFVVSNFEAEAKKEVNPGIGTSPIAQLAVIQAQLADIQMVVDETQAKQDLLDDAIAEVAEGVDDIKLEQFVSKNILCGIATSPTGCLP